jgi:hypothetical protein
MRKSTLAVVLVCGLVLSSLVLITVVSAAAAPQTVGFNKLSLSPLQWLYTVARWLSSHIHEWVNNGPTPTPNR